MFLRLAPLIALFGACCGSCPFRRQAQRANTQNPLLRSALLEASNGPFCGPPLCSPSGGRKLQSEVQLGDNGFPTLEQTTIDAIEASFCAVVDSTADDAANNPCSVSSGMSDSEAKNEGRADITAGVIQLAFHDAGTYDKSNTTDPGGADGCACDKFAPNVGLDYIKSVLEPIYTSTYSEYLSRADFWVICANAAIKSSVPSDYAPLSIGFKYGRADIDCTECSEDVAARLPDESKSTDHVTEVFVDRMGFTRKETVALMGAHSMGKMEPHNTGYAGKWDSSFAMLDSSYYEQILDKPWFRFAVDETTEFEGEAPYPNYVHEQIKHEWRLKGDQEDPAFEDNENKLLNTDMCLAWAIGDGDDVNEGTCITRPCGDDSKKEDEESCEEVGNGECGPQDDKWRSHVVNFAADTALFLKNFASAWEKMTEMTPSALVKVGKDQSLIQQSEDPWTEA